MWRYQMAVKGSEQELRWLNQQAQRGQLLRRIRGTSINFKKRRRGIKSLVNM